MKKMGLEARIGDGLRRAFPFDPQALDKKRAEGRFLPFLFVSSRSLTFIQRDHLPRVLIILSAISRSF